MIQIVMNGPKFKLVQNESTSLPKSLDVLIPIDILFNVMYTLFEDSLIIWWVQYHGQFCKFENINQCKWIMRFWNLNAKSKAYTLEDVKHISSRFIPQGPHL